MYNFKLLYIYNKMKEYIVYGLIDPRNGSICYIGITKRGLRTRLREHNNPKSTLSTIISKVGRHLKKNELKFEGVILLNNLTLDQANNEEIKLIIKFKSICKLYNEKPGGSVGYQSERSKLQISTSRLNNGNCVYKNGEDHCKSTYTEKQVIEIYKLIKKYYSNNEIINKLNLDCKSGTITNLRYGHTWRVFWEKNFKYPIEGFPSREGGVPFRVKIRIIKLIDSGFSIEHISRWIKRVNKYDIKYASQKKIWAKAWVIYEQQKLNQINYGI